MIKARVEDQAEVEEEEAEGEEAIIDTMVEALMKPQGETTRTNTHISNSPKLRPATHKRHLLLP